MQLTREDEARLARAIAAGDNEAFRSLHTAYEKPLYGYLRVRCDNDDARDILQNTWLKFWKSAGNYDAARAGCLTFLKVIAESEISDYYRRDPRRQEINFSSLIEDSAEPERAIEIGDLLARLSPGTIRRSAEATNRLGEDLVLRLIFGGSSPPHQLVAFGFSSRLGWKPGAIVTKLSDTLLAILERRLEDEYAVTSQLSEQTIHLRFQRLRDNMNQLVDDAVTDPKTRETCKLFLSMRVGETHMRQYFTRNPSEDISHWCQAVIRRATSDAASSGRHPKNIVANGCDIQTQPS